MSLPSHLPPLHPDRVRAVLKGMQGRELDPGDISSTEWETIEAALSLILKVEKGVGLSADVVHVGMKARDLFETLGKALRRGR